ncbi:hypothetical protein OIU84_022961 [Salix udensis]|nr:hypothetical protein OIU84_022961 [Salix udensis]
MFFSSLNLSSQSNVFGVATPFEFDFASIVPEIPLLTYGEEDVGISSDKHALIIPPFCGKQVHPVLFLDSSMSWKALMSIKESFSNEANVLLDWDDVHNEDFCSWRGVFCENVSFSVVSLNLSNLNLGGEISPAIGDLIDFLVDLSDNLLYGDIPFSISRLKRLDTLNLKSNQLTGPIPSTLTQLPNLKTLSHIWSSSVSLT